MRLILLIILSIGLSLYANDWEFSWVGEPGYRWDGVEPDYFEHNEIFTFKVRVESDIEPLYVHLNVDANADGFFARNEQIPMELARKDSAGYIYQKKMKLDEPKGNRPLAYYFSAQVGFNMRTSSLHLGPFWEKNVSFVLVGDSLWESDGPIYPLEVLTNPSDNKFLLINTGDTPLTFGLTISEQSKTLWKPISDYDKIAGENKYILSAMFLKHNQDKPDENNFNTDNWEDVLSYQPKFACGEQLGYRNYSAGEHLAPGDTAVLWLNFVAPASSSGEVADQIQSIIIKVFAIGE